MSDELKRLESRLVSALVRACEAEREIANTHMMLRQLLEMDDAEWCDRTVANIKIRAALGDGKVSGFPTLGVKPGLSADEVWKQECRESAEWFRKHGGCEIE